MAKLELNIEKGGLSRQTANTDTWGGLFVGVDVLPTDGGGWTANEVKRIFKVEDLESYGITETATNDYYKLVYWHVSEVFRLAPNATLYLQLGIPAASGTLPVTFMPAFANFEDRIRRFGVVLPDAELLTANITLLQTAMENLFSNSVQGGRVVVSYDKEAADAIPDLSGESNDRVMVDISSDLTSGGLAETVYTGLGMCGAAGTFLGQRLRLSVHQKSSWRSYPINGAGRWLTLGDINGDSVESKTQTEIDAYDTQGLDLIVRTKRLTDAFISNSRMGITTSDDYAIITHGEVIDKAVGLAYDGLVYELDSPVYVDTTTGYLAPEDVSRLQRTAYDEINNNMVVGRTGNAVEVSTDAATGSLPKTAVYINPDQNLLSTEQIVVELEITPVGAAKTIVVNIGLTVPS